LERAFSSNRFEGLRADANGQLSSGRFSSDDHVSRAELQSVYPVSNGLQEATERRRKEKAERKRQKTMALVGETNYRNMQQQMSKKAVAKALRAAKVVARKEKNAAKNNRVPNNNHNKNSSSNPSAQRSHNQRKENVFICPDGQARTWKQLWTAPTSDRSSAPSLPVTVPSPSSSVVMSHAVKRESE
jgi:hypothetical protein